ncbi:zinc finger protein 91-like isoform X3 [Planococcus citri]|uniref:zinc finger protein 91-like isoform X3 n=1 Tax=Planococcus citri TaxID=170843 RepID=UPI0031F78939
METLSLSAKSNQLLFYEFQIIDRPCLKMITVDTILKDFHDLSNLENLCRMCGKNQSSFTPIFDETNRYNYYRVIQQHFRDDLPVSKTDILPLKMCAKCLKLMMSWHEFYLECMKVEKKFKRLIDKFSLTQDPEKRIPAIVNDVEVIEVSVDDETYDFFNENTGEFDISNVNIKESTSFVDTNDLSHFDDLNDSSSSGHENNENKTTKTAETTETTETTDNHSEPVGGDKNPSLTLQRKIKKNKSTVCRICGKLYTNRGTYLTHLQRAHSSHRTTKPVRKPIPLEKQQEIDRQKQEELEQLRAQYLQSKAPRKKRTYAKAVPDMCHMCGKTFKHNSSLRNHLKYIHASNPEAVKHPVRPPKMCDLCGKLCKGSYFKSHMMKHTNPDSVKCKDCGKVFAYESTLRNHIKVCHTDEKPFKCTLCLSSFKRADYLRSHMGYKHPDVKLDDLFKCEHCDTVYKTEKYYLIHMKMHSDGSFEKQKTMRKRPAIGSTARVSPDDPSKYWCEICNLSFKKRNYYLLHERYVHVKGKPYSISENAEGQYKCDQCDRRFSSVTGRNYHCKTVHGKEFDMTFSAKCEHCGLTFRNRVFYAKHRAKLNGMPTCYLCWKQFPTDEELTKHIDVDHFTDLPFVCEICKIRFVALKNLEHHIRTRHLNDKPFKCDICDHRTTRKDSLEIHIRGTHLGERPYQCEVCGKKFSQRNDWRKHGIRHNTT